MYDLYAQFPQQKICKERQYSALLRWAAYFTAQPVPPEKPAKDWVEQRIVSENLPLSPDLYVNLTLPVVLQVTDIQTNIRQHMDQWATEGEKVSLDAQIDSALAAQMPGFCAVKVTDSEVNNWYIDNGFPLV